MIRFFLDHSADAVKNAAVAVAFAERIRTALRAFVEYRRAHPEFAEQLQEQADSTLRYFSHEGNLKWVNLILWAGASQLTRGAKPVNPHGAILRATQVHWRRTAIAGM